MLAGALLATSPAEAQKPYEITDRIEAAFDLVLQNPAEPNERLTRHVRARRAEVEGAAIRALAYRPVEAEPAAFGPGEPADPTTLAIGPDSGGYMIEMARLPKPRPERPFVTGSVAPADETLQDAAPAVPQSDFFGRFAGSFSGGGEVKRDARSGANQVQCTLTGQPTANGISISGKCGASIFSRKVSADIRLDPASGAYRGTYVGADVGPAKLWGKRRGDSVVFVITWPKPVNGDTKAFMTIRNSGDGKLAISVTDQVHPGGPKAEVTRLALNQI